MKLTKYKLGEILDVTRGASLSGEFYATEGKYIRLTCGNFDYQNNCFKENKSKDNLYYVGDFKPEFLMEEGDIITPLTEQAIGLLGSTAIIPESGKYIQSQDVAKIICKEELLDKDFAFYLISSTLVKQQLSAAAQQTKIRHTSPDKIRNCTVWIPELTEQKRIGKLLRSLDRKIELNRAINQNLEAMAKQLYDYWFVQFDFPNEEGKPYKSNGGEMVWNEVLKREIPKDWEVLSFGDLFNIGNGKNIPNSSGTIPAYGGNGIIKYVDKSNYDSCFIVGRVGANCGSLHYSPTKCWVSDNAISVVPKNLNEIAYLLFSLKLYDLSKNKGGSSQPLVTHKGLECLAFPYSVKFVSKFCNIVNKLLNLYFENINSLLSLTKQRNELLPLLMNGQVSVNSDLSDD
ncbi:restriction endonuclease subunit S [Bacteroides fragilis]|uniref:restriction endonuclease subunit S n=1 Tax=Bacteroides fragilis TaxID=817 RepID=UPI000E1E0DC5|nr:restriction endonuclease subunit S [Bacteroides fragilis]RDT76920.1 restriction endonuclease subunit S [Bacteroides fragilis]